MKGANSRILLKPQTKGTQKAVVRRAIAEAVAIERETMKQQKAEKDAEELMVSDLEREEDDNMAEKKVVKKTVEKKEPVKKVVKAAVKGVEETVVKEAEAPVVKAAVVKEDPVKTAPAKEKASVAKKTVVNEEIYVQFGNNEVLTKDIVEKVKKAYVAEGHKADSIQDVRVYVKPEENMVYYVVNNDYASGISLF